MAKIKTGAIVTDIRGKLAGHVFSKNRAGNVMRTKVTPTNAQTSFQQNVRALFTLLSQAWRGLTAAQRTAWNAAVTSYQKTNVFGDLVSPSGFNLFQKLNNNLQSIGVAVISDPPLPSAVGACVADVLTVDNSTPSVSLTFAPTVPANTAVKVFATAPTSPGKSFLKNQYRAIGTIAAAATSPASLTSEYVAKFGSVGEVGQKIAVKLIPINMTTGQAGGVSEAVTIVVT